MKLTTLCYVEKYGKYLLLLRNSPKKRDDPSYGKWIGVGGKLEKDETPDECARREVLEETGLTAVTLKPRGIVTFISDKWETEYMFLYTVTEFEGGMGSCDEGELYWVQKDQIFSLNLWDGDRIFLHLMRENAPYFDMKLIYHGDRLNQCFINGRQAELFDVMKPDGTPANYVAERSYVHAAGLWHSTVHIWVIRTNAEGKTELLLQKRSADKDSNPGCYDVSAAGHIATGESVTEAALRELSEELGIQAEAADLESVGTRKVEFDGVFHDKLFCDKEIGHIFIYRKPVDVQSLKLQQSEVEAVRWMEFDACRDAIVEDTVKHCIYTEELDMIAKKF